MCAPFGFFLLLAFAGAYFAFRSEYKRKEAEGLISIFSRRVNKTPGLIWVLAGFVIGAKLVYWWQYRAVYIGTPAEYIFSLRGSLAGGLVTAFASWVVVRVLKNPASAVEWVHPYQLMDSLLLYCGLWGFAGAVIFARFESPHSWEGLSFGNLF